jgi:hypothetical protein
MTKRSTNRSKAALGHPRDLETTASILRAALDLADERARRDVVSNRACVKPWAALLVHLMSSRVTMPRCSFEDETKQVRRGIESTCLTIQ